MTSAPNTCPCLCTPEDRRRRSCWRTTALVDSADRLIQSAIRNGGVLSFEAARRWLEEKAKICAEVRS